jgi:arylsulfatase A-like enzyme
MPYIFNNHSLLLLVTISAIVSIFIILPAIKDTNGYLNRFKIALILVIIPGFIFGILNGMPSVVSNGYLQYEMYYLIAHVVSSILNHHLLTALGTVVFVFITLPTILVSLNAIGVSRKASNTITCAMVPSLLILTIGGYLINKLYLPGFFELKSIIGNAIWAITSALVGWAVVWLIFKISQIRFDFSLRVYNAAKGCSFGILGLVILLNLAQYLYFLSIRPDRPNLILITIDTLRADHLGCYGYPRDTSPFIDSLANRGVIFTRAFASMATTAPSHASILTSLYPIQHNVRKNGHVLDDSFLTMAEFLLGMGYKTAGFVSTNVHFKVGNMNQGFELFDEPPKTSSERVADQTVSRAIKWLDKRTLDDRFFLWIHLFDPHTPYNPLNRFPEQSADEKERFVNFLLNRQHIDFDFYGKSRYNLLSVMDSYDGEILAVDSAIRDLFNHMDKKGLNANTIWIITSDHGEGLGNHRYKSHGRLIYNETIRVPLIFYFSSGTFSNRVVDHVVEHIDVLPTIAELVGVRSNGWHVWMQGVSLVPLFLKQYQKFPNKYAFSQRREYDGENIVTSEANDEGYEDGEKYALQDTEYKYILHTKGGDEFFNIADDPYEVTNLIGRGFAEEDRLREALISRIGDFKRQIERQPESVDQETVERLRSLGYTQ